MININSYHIYAGFDHFFGVNKCARVQRTALAAALLDRLVPPILLVPIDAAAAALCCTSNSLYSARSCSARCLAGA